MKNIFSKRHVEAKNKSLKEDITNLKENNFLAKLGKWKS